MTNLLTSVSCENEIWLLPEETDEDVILFWAFGKDADRDKPFQIAELYDQQMEIPSDKLGDNQLFLSVIDSTYDIEVMKLIATLERCGSFEIKTLESRIGETEKRFIALIERIFEENPGYVKSMWKVLRRAKLTQASLCGQCVSTRCTED